MVPLKMGLDSIVEVYDYSFTLCLVSVYQENDKHVTCTYSKAVYKPVKYRLKVLPVTPYENITTKFLHEIIDCSYDYPENIICSIN